MRYFRTRLGSLIYWHWMSMPAIGRDASSHPDSVNWRPSCGQLPITRSPPPTKRQSPTMPHRRQVHSWQSLRQAPKECTYPVEWKQRHQCGMPPAGPSATATTEPRGVATREDEPPLAVTVKTGATQDGKIRVRALTKETTYVCSARSPLHHSTNRASCSVCVDVNSTKGRTRCIRSRASANAQPVLTR